MSILGFLLVLFPIVIIHEFGHFLFARMNGIDVLKFSVGFGGDRWALFSWIDKYGTKWQITPFLLGGFVTMKGQYDNPEDQLNYDKEFKNLSIEEKKNSFLSKNRAQKIAVAFAGPLFNLILSIIILFCLSLFYGKPVTSNKIGGFTEDSVAKLAGLKVGDEIIKINNKQIKSFSDIMIFVKNNSGKIISIVVNRSIQQNNDAKLNKKQTLSFNIKPMKVNKEYKLGIYSDTNVTSFNKIGFVDSIVYSFKHTKNLIHRFLSDVWQLIKGNRSSKEIGGIISIASISGRALNHGFYSVMYLMAFLSIVIGVMNLMPIPVLDGGQIFIYAFESIIRRDLPIKIKSSIFMLGWILVMFLMILATYNDIKQFIINKIVIKQDISVIKK